MSAIEDLQQKVQRLRAQLADAEAKLRAARLAAAPVKVGDVVMTRKGEMRVAHIEARYNWLSLKGNPRKKNGEWSQAEHNIYGEWKVVDEDGPYEDDSPARA